MAQKRYHNFEQPLESLHENNRLGNLVFPGVYAGFDNMEVVSGTSMKIKHNVSGAMRTNGAVTNTEGPFGIVVSRQGTVIEDDQEFPLTVPYTTVNSRIDTIIAQHSHLESTGGSAMVVGRIQGAEAVNPIAPEVDNPLIQVVVGYLWIKTVGNHTGTKFIPAQRRKLGGYFGFDRKDPYTVDRAISDDFNDLTTSGIFGVITTPENPGNRPADHTNPWAVIVIRSPSALSQIAVSALGGRTYSRSAIGLIGNKATGWTPWQSMNNTEVVGPDLSWLTTAVGDLQYTEENVVTSGEPLTNSIDNLDIAYQVLNLALGTTQSNLTSTNNAVSALQAKWAAVAASGPLSNLNLQTTDASKHFVSGTLNEPPGNVSHGLLTVAASGAVIQQWVRYPSGLVYYRVTTNFGAAWSGWGLKEYAKAVFDIDWNNMDTTSSITITHGIDASKVRRISAWVYNDAGTRIYDLTQSGSSALATNEVSGQILIDTTNIVLARTSGGIFDDTNFDDATGLPNGKRGQVLIEMVA